MRYMFEDDNGVPTVSDKYPMDRPYSKVLNDEELAAQEAYEKKRRDVFDGFHEAVSKMPKSYAHGQCFIDHRWPWQKLVCSYKKWKLEKDLAKVWEHPNDFPRAPKISPVRLRA